MISSNPPKHESLTTQVDAPGSKHHHNYTRIVRRPGRARDNDIEGDEVIKRTRLSDSESEASDDEDTAFKADDNDDTEGLPGALTVPTVPTPETYETSPPYKPAEDTSAVAATAEPPKEVFQLWSDAVAKDKAGKGEDLTVIDFAELSTVPPDESVTTLLDKKKRRKKKKAKSDQSSTPKQGGPSASASGGPSASPAPAPAPGDSPPAGGPSTSSTTEPPTDSPAAPTPSSSKPLKHVPSYLTAPQSHLKKLNSDPAATPKVGQFYGHDDLLMDKELRPLSDWWRGRWQDRGRGRGRGRGSFRERGMRGRGDPPFPGAQTTEPAPEQQEARPADSIEERWTHDAHKEHEKQVSARKCGRRGTGRGRGRGGRGGGRIRASPSFKRRPKLKRLRRSRNGRTLGRLPQHYPTPGVSDGLAQAVKERETEKSKGVVAAAKSEVAAAGQQAGTSNVSSASAANAAPTANGAPVQVKLPGSTAHTGGQHRSTIHHNADPLATTPRQGVQPKPSPGSTVEGQHRRTETLERAVVKEASDAVASPPATQPPITVNAPLVTQPSTNPGYSYIALPPGIDMGESGILFEIAIGRPLVHRLPLHLRLPSTTLDLSRTRTSPDLGACPTLRDTLRVLVPSSFRALM
ncbi:hypothetical protein FRB90_010863 [Tulasnella sp. 427]|nr:hypothetical protein FRB90_010863 [Tulasnella sp. 427]